MKRVLLAVAASRRRSPPPTPTRPPPSPPSARLCHGASGEGGAMHKASIKGLPEAKVLKAINEGVGKMKPVKIDDAAAVAKYVAGLK